MTVDPVLAKARHHRLLSGLSGARVYLLTEDGTNWFVRKAASVPESNDRLRRQRAKQESYHALMASTVRTPAVLNTGEIDGRIFFDMEFVRGTDGAAFLRHASIAAVKDFSSRLCQYLTTAAEMRSGASVDAFAVLFARVADVQSTTGDLADDLLGRLLLLLDRVRRLGPLETTLCHGDLTLENLVVSADGTIWLIDFLDAPIEHYWADVAKLHQDLAGGWYLRRVAPISRGVLEYVSRATLAAVAKRGPEYAQIHFVLLACTFARILPYVRQEDDRRTVLQRIGTFVRCAQDELQDEPHDEWRAP